MEIVGIVGDVRQYGLGENIPAGLYLPHRQNAWSGMSVVIRTTGPQPLGVLSSVRSVVRAIDPALWFEPQAMEQLVQRSFWARRFMSQLFGAFSMIALALAAVGIAAVVTYSVTQRTQEIGIRMAIGAGRSEILRLVVAQGMTPVAIGVAVGLLASLGLTRVLSSQLYGVGAFDPLSLGVATIVFIVVAFLACIIPAGQAARIDPMVALRSE
jgi:putative ABC transport system permease protein